jgi:hypothetical protein
VYAALSEVEEHGADRDDAGRDDAGRDDAAGGTGGARRRVLVHASGFKQSPYADIKPAGGDVRDSRKLPEEGHAVPEEGAPPRKLWHASPGSSGH